MINGYVTLRTPFFGMQEITSKDDFIFHVREFPTNVRFHCTNVIGSFWEGRISDLPANTTLFIRGEPESDKPWRATIRRGRHGFQIR